MSIAEISQLSLSPDTGNQLVILHFGDSNTHNDLVLTLISKKNEDLVGELVGVLGSAFAKKLGRPLNVMSANLLRARSGKQVKMISVPAGASGPNATFVKNKDGSVNYVL